MKFIDTHIHLQDFNANYTPQLIKKSVEAGIEGFICVSTSEKDWASVAKLSEEYEEITPAFGLHPWYVAEAKEDTISKLETYLQQYPKSLTGECGLDGLKPEREKQEKLFAAQIELAQKYKRPILIHTVKSGGMLEKFWPKLKKSVYVIHSFSGSLEQARQILQNGGYISFSLSILRNKEREKILNFIPRDKLLLETDSPYQGLSKGAQNTPLNLPYLLQEIAKIRQENAEDLAQTIYQNSQGLINGTY